MAGYKTCASSHSYPYSYSYPYTYTNPYTRASGRSS